MSVAPREDSLPIDDSRKIDEICDGFEKEWLAGRRPSIEPFLQQIHHAAQPALLRELIELELDYRRGLKEDLSPDDFLRRFPRMRDVISAAFESAYARPVPVRFLPGSMIGRYEVRGTLGTGAFAVVYLAWDGQLEREVAVKVPHRFLLSDHTARARFLAEARTVARLRHPRIVALYDVAELPEKETIYLVMEYIPGESLRQRLCKGPLSPNWAGQIAAKVADAMAAAHRAGVFHRDLKPSNILLDEHNEPHVCDFGLAVHVDEQRGRQGEYAGTLAYMAPEQTRGEAHRLDGRADIWALGVIQYEMLTGSSPFVGRHRDELFDEVLNRDPRPPRQLDPRISREQERICLRCLAKQPSDRFATASDVANALRALERTRLPRSLLLIILATVVSLACLAIAPWWFYSQSDKHLPPTYATLDLRIWDPQRPHRRGVLAGEPDSLPLCDGDRVRVSAELNQPAYVYVLWLDSRGGVLPVYPWRQGVWEQRPTDERPTRYLELPDEQDAGWRMHVDRDGMESLLLLARSSPLPDQVDLQQLLADIRHQTLAMTSVAVSFQDGRPVPEREEQDSATQRPPDLKKSVRIPDPLLQMQRRTAEILRPHFDLIRAVSFPVQSE